MVAKDILHSFESTSSFVNKNVFYQHPQLVTHHVNPSRNIGENKNSNLQHNKKVILTHIQIHWYPESLITAERSFQLLQDLVGRH